MISNSVSTVACQNMFLLEKSFKKHEKKSRWHTRWQYIFVQRFFKKITNLNDDDSKWPSPTTMNQLILNDFRFRRLSNVEVVRQPAYPPSYAFAVIDSELIRQNHQKHFWQKFVALEHRHDHDSGSQPFVYFQSNRKCKSDQIQEKDLDEQGQGRNHHHHLNWVEYRYRPEGPNFFHKWLLEFA